MLYGNLIKNQVALKSCGGTIGKIYKIVVDTNIDYLFVVTYKIDMYMIPKGVINNRSTLNLCNKYKGCRVIASKIHIKYWQICKQTVQ